MNLLSYSYYKGLLIFGCFPHFFHVSLQYSYCIHTVRLLYAYILKIIFITIRVSQWIIFDISRNVIGLTLTCRYPRHSLLNIRHRISIQKPFVTKEHDCKSPSFLQSFQKKRLHVYSFLFIDLDIYDLHLQQGHCLPFLKN